MQAIDYPRVAIVSSNPMRSDQCNGILMKSLFQGWPSERLAQVYFPMAVTWIPDDDLCAEYRSISPWGHVCRVARSPQKNSDALAKALSCRDSSPRYVRRAADFVKKRQSLMNWLRPCAELWSANFPLARLLERQLRELRPDCVYALLGNYHLTKITYLACSRLRLPVYLHVTDDFVTAHYQGMRLGRRMQTLSDRWFRRTVDYSSGLAAISPIMADEFGRRYGKRWSWFATGVQPNEYDCSPRDSDDTIRLVYTGSLGLGRWKTLRALGMALQLLSQDIGRQIRLAVHAPEDQLRAYRNVLTIPQTVELRGWARPEELPHIFHNADILVHVESFDPMQAAYTRLSFSTKLSQYMMAGRCILAVGPAEAGSLRMVAQAAAGMTASDAEPAALARAIAPLIGDRRRQQSLGNQGREWALRWCERENAHNRFRCELLAVARRQCIQPSPARLAG